MCRPAYPPVTRLSREACPRPRSGSGNPSLTRLSRGSGNPYVLDVGLPLDKPKVHGKTGVVAKTKRLQGIRAPDARHTRRSPVIPAKLVPDPDRGAGIHRSPVFPAEAGIHTFLMLDCHWTRPKCMGKQESSRKLKDFMGSDRCFNLVPPVIPAAHPSFPRGLSPTPIGERGSIPPLTRLSRESGNPYLLDVELALDQPKVHGKTGVVAKTKRL